MASRTSHLPFLTFLITFLSISTDGKFVNSPPSPCASFDCGNGLIIGYPFHQNKQPTFCGYPNFTISCSNNQPLLQIEQKSYIITKFNASEKTLMVTYNELNDTTTCPIVTHSMITFEPTHFLNYTKDNKIAHFYYNCTVYPSSDIPNIKCLQRGAKHSYAFFEGHVPEFDWIEYCESIVSVPVIDETVDDLVANGLANVLKEGFKLTWKPLDNTCQLCEASGGFCGNSYSNVGENFICFCNDGHHSPQNCLEAGEVSITSQPNYVAVGAVVIGGMIVISVVVFFIYKKQIGGQKRGFSQIPSNCGNSAN